MSDDACLRAYAKINLLLAVTGTAPNGFHTVEMVMQSVGLFDTVRVVAADDIQISCSDASIPCDNRNICYKAAEAFFDYSDIKAGAHIFIDKNIPVAAGLGGGSTDAAAVIKALNSIYATNYSDETLCAVGQTVGADVPFCINGGTQLAEGIGTILTPLPDLCGCCFVIIKHKDKISTASMYDMLEQQDNAEAYTQRLVECICENDLYSAAEYITNAFEPLWGEDTRNIKLRLLDEGAFAASLSGSGPSVFGVFDSISKAQKCADRLKCDYDCVFVCEPVGYGLE